MNVPPVLRTRQLSQRCRCLYSDGAVMAVIAVLTWWACACLLSGCGPQGEIVEAVAEGPFHVHVGDDLTVALNRAAAAKRDKRVIVHEGSYGPSEPAFALIRLFAKHDGISLLAEGDVTLTARASGKAGETAIVNHVVYCDEGITARTVIEGFRITGANGFVAPQGPAIPQNFTGLRQGMFFHLDGGGLKVFGRSSPTIRRVEFVDNATRLCGGAVSIEQQGRCEQPVHFEDCRFINNRCPATGAAIDVLEGSAARIENCLFVGNIANFGMDEVQREFGLSYNAEHGSGALTVFPNSRVDVRRATFTGNWNGVDDHGSGSVYESCLLWMNDASDGSRPGKPYEFDILDATGVRNCVIHGVVNDLQGTISTAENSFDLASPEFDEQMVPKNPNYADVGYRPVHKP